MNSRLESVMLMLAVAVVAFLATMQPVQSASAQQSGAPIPRLVIHESRGSAGEPLPLGLMIEGSAEGAIIILTGLVPEMTLSNGSPAGTDSWQVPAADLANTWVGPPVGFVGTLDLVAELQFDGARFSDQQPIRLEWLAAAPAVAAEVATTAPVPEAPSVAPVPMTMPGPEAVPSTAEVPTAMLVPEAVAIPRQRDPPEIKTQQPGQRTAHKRVPSKVAVPMREKKPVEASVLGRAREAPAPRDASRQMHSRTQPTQQQDDQPTGGISNDAPGILGFLLPRRRSESVTEGADPTGRERTNVATVSSDKASREEADKPPPARLRNQCNYQVCGKTYRSFRESDCTYQPPHGGSRKICERGRLAAKVPQVQAQRPAQQCNPVVCAQFYRSFDPSDCTFQPISGGARKTCER
jgi:BA14K-like protein